MYSQTQLLEIAKKLLIFAGYSKKLSAGKAEKILKELKEIQKNIEKNTDSVSKKILIFLDDIIGDISRGDAINIDQIEHDEYIENFLVSDQLVGNYNMLLKKEDFTNVQEILIAGKNELGIKKAQEIQKDFTKYLGNISSKDFSKNLLIINKFQLSRPRKYIHYLYELSISRGNVKIAEILLDMLHNLDMFTYELKKEAIEHIKNSSMQHKYMICSIQKNTLSFSALDATTGQSPTEYYKKLLLSI